MNLPTARNLHRRIGWSQEKEDPSRDAKVGMDARGTWGQNWRPYRRGMKLADSGDFIQLKVLGSSCPLFLADVDRIPRV